MSYLEDLVKERDSIRSKEKELTEKIKIERKVESEKRLSDSKSDSKRDKRTQELIKENARLRAALIASEYIGSDRTMEAVARHYGISGSRAAQIVRKYLRDILRINDS